MSAELMVSAGALVVGVVVWLVRLEGKVLAQAQLHDRLVDDVAYIRSRIDSALNGHS